MVGGRKVVGSAQVRQGGALLQHGSILLGDDQRLVGTVTLGEAPDDGSAPLEELLGREISVDDTRRRSRRRRGSVGNEAGRMAPSPRGF